MGHGKTEKVRIIVAFGDIEGFTSFLDAITNEAAELYPYMDKFDHIVEDIEKQTGFHFRDTGDGFMCVVDINEANTAAAAVAVVTALLALLQRMEQLRESMVHPRWTGFRIVLTSGYVSRKIRKDGHITLRGRHINMAHNALDMARGHGIVCHISFKALISDAIAKKHGFEFIVLPWPRRFPDNMPRKDANSFFILRMKRHAKNLLDRKG